MDKEQARKLYELADRLSKLDVNTLSEQQLAERSAMIAQLQEVKQRLDPKCWDGYKKQGTKMKGDTRVNNCVPESVTEGLESLRAKAKEISDKIDAIVKSGGRVGLDDPLSRQLKAIHSKIKQAKQGVAEGLNEFAPGSGGGESGRWYTDDQMTDIVGDGWWNDLDVSGNIPKQQMIQQAQAWLDDQGYSVQVLNAKLNDDDMDWFIQGSFHNPGFAKKGVAEGYTVTRGIDRERYQERQGLEGPFITKSGKVVYYDKVEGKYYDPDTDMYIEYADWQAMNEDAEYNDEAGMAESNLHTMARAVAGLIKTIESDDNLPEWAQEKIAKAEMMITSVWDYLLSQKEQGVDPKVQESKKPSPKLTPVNIKKTDAVSEEINTEAYERLQKVFAFKNYES